MWAKILIDKRSKSGRETDALFVFGSIQRSRLVKRSVFFWNWSSKHQVWVYVKFGKICWCCWLNLKVIMVNLAGVIKFILCYALCLFYTATISFGLVVAFLLKGKSKIWVVKKRLIPPQCLQDKAYGEHKYITVNVSDFFWLYRFFPDKL